MSIATMNFMLIYFLFVNVKKVIGSENDTPLLSIGEDDDECQGGWYGLNCTECDFLLDCSPLNNGSANEECTGCTCEGNWDPMTNCSSCFGGWTGDDCENCDLICENGGTWDTYCTICECSGNWNASMNCSVCLGGWEGENCSFCPLDTICQNNGIPNGFCTICDCNGEWIDENCTTCGLTECNLFLDFLRPYLNKLECECQEGNDDDEDDDDEGVYFLGIAGISIPGVSSTVYTIIAFVNLVVLSLLWTAIWMGDILIKLYVLLASKKKSKGSKGTVAVALFICLFFGVPCFGYGVIFGVSAVLADL